MRINIVEVQKAELLRQIEEAEGNWELVEELARRGLQLYPDWFEAATRWQAACIEIAAKCSQEAEMLMRDFWNQRSRAIEAVSKARKSIDAALEANRFVRRLADAQQGQ